MLGTATAALEPKEFVDPGRLTDAQIEQMKAKSRNADMIDFGKDKSVKTAPIPWNTVVFVIIVLAVVAPFAWSAYLRSVKEIEANAQSAGSPRTRDDA
jgi:hypothetical protein